MFAECRRSHEPYIIGQVPSAEMMRAAEEVLRSARWMMNTPWADHCHPSRAARITTAALVLGLEISEARREIGELMKEHNDA